MTDVLNKRLIIGIVGFAIVLMLAISGILFTNEIARIREEKATRATVMGELPDFSLINQQGKRVGRSDLLGRVNVVSFMFTECAGPCPALIGQIARLRDDWKSIPDVQFVSISVDPERDVPEVLAAYALRFGAKDDRWHFLTGEEARVYDLIRNGFRASVDESDGPHQILHSLKFAVVDKRGRIRAYLDGASKTMLDDARLVVRRLLAEN